MKLLVLSLCLTLAMGYETLNTEREVMMHYEKYSNGPIFHIHANRHFLKSKQFVDFL